MKTGHESVFHQLLGLAHAQGFLSLQDISEVCNEEDPKRLARMAQRLYRHGVEIVGDDGEDLITGGEEQVGNIEQVATDDTISMYLREMARVPLLELSEEIDLARRIEQGRAAQRKLKASRENLDAETRAALEKQIEDGRLAREHLIKANTRLVVSIAKRYAGRGLPLLDLIQEGNLGLMKAIEKFEYKRGFRFSTYATWWIRQSVTRALANQGRTIRVPVHMLDQMHNMYRITQDLEQENQHPATPEEIAHAMNLPLQRVCWMQRLAWTPLSLENPLGDDEDDEFGQFIEDTNAPSPSQRAVHQALCAKISEVLATLSPREARILKMRFGLENGEACTLEEVGQRFGLSRERIRQIENKALRRLRHPMRARQLQEYL